MSTTSTYLQLDEKSHHHNQKNYSDIDRHVFLLSNAINATYTSQHQVQSRPSDPKSKSRFDFQQQQQTQEPRQSALFLKGVREQYTLVTDHVVPPILHRGEILIKVVAIGLNPIDWKAPAFNFGIPSLPWINGRDLAGTVIKIPDDDDDGCLDDRQHSTSRLRVGDNVLVPSTDYRDIRKAAFQEYAIATHYNAVRIPPTVSIHASASLGVAFVASVLGLGVSFGLDISSITSVPGPDFVEILQRIGEEDPSIPEDVRAECFRGKEEKERIKKGDWIAIWGASTTTGYITLQLAKLAGLKVICIADIARHGERLYHAGADLLVDRQDPNRAIQIIRGVTRGKLRYAIDIVGRETATILQEALQDNTAATTTTTTNTTTDIYTDHSTDTAATASATNTEHNGLPEVSNSISTNEHGTSHLLGLTGLPKEQNGNPNFHYHTVPIKLFHSSPLVGESLAIWLEQLLETGNIRLPETVHAEGGLGGINAALETLKDGSVSGKRVVVGL